VLDGEIKRGAIRAGLSARHDLLNARHKFPPMVAPSRRFVNAPVSSIASLLEHG
jgi:hypothetical protein